MVLPFLIISNSDNKVNYTIRCRTLTCLFNLQVLKCSAALKFFTLDMVLVCVLSGLYLSGLAGCFGDLQAETCVAELDAQCGSCSREVSCKSCDYVKTMSITQPKSH